jgi:hypothetical protein
MLALMASRNAAHGVAMVHRGEVSRAFELLSMTPLRTQSTVYSGRRSHRLSVASVAPR